MWYEAKAKAEKQAEIDKVRDLNDWDPAAPPKRFDMPDPDEDDPNDPAAPAPVAATSKKASKKKK